MKLSAHEQGVMATALDALSTKYYAAQLGYFKDDQAQLFIQRKRKMYPIINRGTWSRVQSYRQIVLKFLNAFKDAPRVNVVSLGAGYDSTFFWLNELSEQESGLPADFTKDKLCYVEVDYDQVVERKIQVINGNEGRLKQHINFDMAPESAFEVNSKNYKLLAQDVC
mmetsp:Transcript_32100/g.49084  ORF Transcript_32100/g.49084 Transcript_32100/m.49084 type:complete len:167 (+) Transcript_32100:25-525(+)